MKDSYLNFSHSKLGNLVFSALGLTIAPRLLRYKPGDSLVKTSIILNRDKHVSIVEKCFPESQISIAGQVSTQTQALIFDATDIMTIEQLNECHVFFSRQLKQLSSNGRVIIVGKTITNMMTISQASAQRALVGIVKSIAKEIGRQGSSANLIYTSLFNVENIACAARFFVSNKSTYVSGQVIHADINVNNFSVHAWEKPLQGKTALVTGASRGIGAAIAEVLAKDGATIIGLDIPAAKEALSEQMKKLNGQSILLDVTQSNAPANIAEVIKDSLDIIVHNAGITRDKTLKRMSYQQWQSVIDINLACVARINEYFLAHECLSPQAKIVCVSSISGIAGNVGQVNYAASKSGIIGLVESTATRLAAQGSQITINGVAPGFIETQMTAKIPLMTRHIGRRLCSLSQGGHPEDVANAIAFIASPNAQSLNGNILRVCGQNLMGA